MGNAYIDPSTNRYTCFTCGSNGVAELAQAPAPVVAPKPDGYSCPKCRSTRVAPTSPTGNYACGNPGCMHTWVLGAEEASLASQRPGQIDATLGQGKDTSTALGKGGGSPRG